MVEARIAERDRRQEFLLQHLDRMFARQTAELLNIAGKMLRKDVTADKCMTFAWDKKKDTEMTEEEFERNMDAWVIASREMHNG